MKTLSAPQIQPAPKKLTLCKETLRRLTPSALRLSGPATWRSAARHDFGWGYRRLRNG